MKLRALIALAMLLAACSKRKETDAIQAAKPTEAAVETRQYTALPEFIIYKVEWIQSGRAWLLHAAFTNTTNKDFRIDSAFGFPERGVIPLRLPDLRYEYYQDNKWKDTTAHPYDDLVSQFSRNVQIGEKVELAIRLFLDRGSNTEPGIKPDLKYRIVYEGVPSNTFTFPPAE